ncbi:MAG: FlgD immunoglobulin-like domain containing protein [Candidatus Eisenbacteria bacterium]
MKPLGIACLAALSLSAVPAQAQTVTTAVCGINVNADCAVDAVGNIYLSNAANMIAKITPEGDASLVDNVPCVSCNGMTFDAAGENLYVANTFSGGGVIYRMAPDGTFSTYASGLVQPLSLAFGPDGYLFATGATNVYRIASDGTNQVIGGPGINRPHGLAVDPEGNVYVASAHDGNIYRLVPDGGGGYVQSWFAFVDGLIAPWSCGYMTYAQGSLFITNGDNIVHRISIPDGVVSDYAGSGDAGWDDGPAAQATFIAPNGICASPDGSLTYVAEYAEGRLRKIEGTPAAVDPMDGDTSRLQLRILPNPSGARSVLEFALPAAERVRLAVYGAGGEIVRMIADGERSGGLHQEVWDGRAEDGRLVPSGVYFCRLETAEGTAIRRMTMIK